jgi:hypothetical protein
VCRIRTTLFVLSLYSYEMNRDDLNEYDVDLEARRLARPATDTRAAQLDQVCSGRHCAVSASGTLRADRTDSPGRFGAGATVMALSPTEKWGWFVTGLLESIILCFSALQRIGQIEPSAVLALISPRFFPAPLDHAAAGLAKPSPAVQRRTQRR